MSQRIEEIFSKYKKVFKARKEEIKEFLLKHFEDAFSTKPVINVERKDATNRLKLSGFSSNLSSWRNFYRNIVVSSCVKENGAEKRYDYKFYFTKEKVDEATIEIIQNALDESSRLRRNFQFDEALDKIDDMIELARKKKDEALENILNENRSEVVAEKQKYDKGMEQIAKLEEKIKINQEYDNLKAVISDCDKLTKIAYSIKRSDFARKYTGILEDTKKELAAREAQERERSLEEKKALEEKRAKEKHDKAITQIAELENKIKISLNNDDLKSAISDCEKIIEIANLIDKSDIAEKYKGILEDAKKELETRKAQEKARALEEKQALKEQKAKEKAKKLEEKRALKEQKAKEKAKNLEEKRALKEQKAKEKSKILEEKEALREPQILEQIAQLENQVAINRENDNLPAVIGDCEQIIKLANFINRNDIAEKYNGILEDTKKELAARKAQEKARALEEKQALKEQKAQEKAKMLKEKRALKEQKTLEKIETKEKRRALKKKTDPREKLRKLLKLLIIPKLLVTLKAERKKKSEIDKDAIKEKKDKVKYYRILKQITLLENRVANNRENDNLLAVISDCKQIIKLAKSINRNEIAEKYLGILNDTKYLLEERNEQEKANKLEEKGALKEQKALSKAKTIEEKGVLKKQRAQEKAKSSEEKKLIKKQKAKEKTKLLDEKKALKEQYTLEQIAQLENQIAINRKNDNLKAVVNDCNKIIKLANSIGKDDIADKYSGILEETKKKLEARKAQERAKVLEEKRSRKEAKVVEKKVKVKAIASLIIIGGILIIISSILNIIVLFTMIYTNISVTIGMETADTFFIFLYANGCICVLGGILVIFGSKEHISENHRFGNVLTGFGVVLALIGSSMFLIVGLWAALLCGNQTTNITILILIFFGICLFGILLSIVSQKKIEGKEEEIIKSKYPKGDKLLEKKSLTPQEQYH